MANTFLTRVKEQFRAIFKRSSKFKSVEDLILQEKYDEALSEVENIVNQKQIQLQDDEKVKGNILKSQIYSLQGNFERASELADSCFQESKALENRTLMIEAKILKADILWDLKKLDESFNTVESAEKMLDTLENSAQKELDRYTALISTIKGNIYRRKGDGEQALKYLQISLDLNKKLKNEIEIAQTLNVLGILYATKGDFDQALDILFESLNTYEKLGIQRGSTFKLYNNVALIYQYKGQSTDALDYYQKALDMSEEYGNPQMVAGLVFNIGQINYNLGEYNEALENLEKALEGFQVSNIKLQTAKVLDLMGNIYTAKGDVDKGLDFLNQGLLIYQELEVKGDIGGSYQSIGEAHQIKGNLSEAVTFMNKSSTIFERNRK